MDPASLRTLLDSVADGTLSPEDALWMTRAQGAMMVYVGKAQILKR